MFSLVSPGNWLTLNFISNKVPFSCQQSDNQHDFCAELKGSCLGNKWNYLLASQGLFLVARKISFNETKFHVKKKKWGVLQINAHVCWPRSSISYQKYTHSFNDTTCIHSASPEPHARTDKSVNSFETGLYWFFITTLSAVVLPQMPFIMQILNGVCLIYQAWWKKHSAGNIINNTLSKAFLL